MAATRLPRMVALSCLLAVAGCQGGGSPDSQGGDGAVDGTDTQIADSLVLAAQASEASGDWEAAAQYWGSLLQRDPNNERYARSLGESLRHTGNYAEAVQVLRQGAALNPQSEPILAELGKAQLAAGQRDEAIATLTQAQAMDGTDWTVASALAVAYGMAGMPDLADQHYRQALALAPQNPVVLNNYALHLAINGRLDDGLKLMEDAVRLPGASSQIRQNLALLLAVKGDMGRAEEIVRAELPRNDADRQMAFLRTLSSDDLINLGGMVDQSEMVIDSTALLPPAGTGNVADLTNTGAGGASFLEDQPGVEVIEEELLVAPELAPAEPADTMGEQTLAQQSAALSASLADALESNGNAGETVEAVAVEEAEPLPQAVTLPADEPSTPPIEETVVEEAIVEDVVAEAAPEPVAAPALPLEEEPVPEPVAVVVAAPAPEPVAIAATEPVADPAPEPVVEAVTEPAAEPAPVPAGPAWRVQLASLASEDAAEVGRSRALAAHAGLLGTLPVDIVSALLDNGNTTWRVLAGRYADKGDAVALCEALRTEGGDCFVMKDNAGG